jgi:structure-specific endonuclease subunit SLX1
MERLLTATCRWALTNPHLSMHIPSPARISISTQRKQNGHPRRPRASMSSIISNLHLLVGVPSFARWPLQLHFFNRAVHTAWEKWCATAKAPMRSDVPILTDFGGDSAQTAPSITNEGEGEASATEAPSWGIHTLPLDYAPIKDYVAKGREVFSFEREGNCVVCKEHMPLGEGVYALCSNNGCEGVGHLSCWSRHMLPSTDDECILPVEGSCPKCQGPVKWGDMMRELTLRLRGANEVDKLLKKKRTRKAKS